MAHKHFTVSGRVQGVGYRYWTQKTARLLSLTGWVRNLPNGDVELIACGPDEELAKLEESLWKGPSFSKVAAVAQNDVTESETYSDFNIRY